jgi:hypothetical protein
MEIRDDLIDGPSSARITTTEDLRVHVPVHATYGLRAQAEQLMAMPTEDGRETAGPTFAYVAPRDRE